MPNRIRCSWNSIVFGLSIFNIALKKGWQESIYHQCVNFFLQLKGAYCFAHVSRLVFRQSNVRSISFDPFAWKLPNLVQCMPLDVPYWFSGHMVKGLGQTAGLCTNDFRSTSFDSFAWKLANLVQWMPLQSRYSLLIFWLQCQRSRSNCWSASYSISHDPLFDGQTCYLGWLLWEDYPYWSLGHKVKVKLLIFISALFVQYFLNHLLDNYQTWYSGCH